MSLAIALAASVSFGCERPEARDPNTLVVVQDADGHTLDPLFAVDAESTLYYGLVLEPLVAIGPNFRPVPWLATSWHSTPDRLHWTVRLRRGVRWSDGAPFSSADVVWTWRAMLDPATGFPYAGTLSYVKDVVPLGEHAVRFDLKSTNALFIDVDLNWPIMPAHLRAKTPDAELSTSSFGSHPVGTGPYELATWDHDSEVSFVRNPHWWRGEPKIRRIEFRIVLDGNARVEAMENGSADLYGFISSDDYATLRKNAPQLKFLKLPDLYTIFIMPNLRTPGLSDVTVRRAMMYGWDRKAVVDRLDHHGDVLAASIVPVALTYWYDPDVRHYPYDPARARAMLDAAGWRVGPDGIRRKGGRELSFALSLPSGSVESAALCTEFQADMRSIGIGVTLKELDYATLIQRTGSFQYQLAFTGWGGKIDPDEFTFFDSSQLVPVGNNDTGFTNARLDHDLRAGRTTIAPAKRKPYYDDMQRITADRVPVLWAWYPYFRAAYSPRLHFNTGDVQPDLYLWSNVGDWTLQAPRERPGMSPPPAPRSVRP